MSFSLDIEELSHCRMCPCACGANRLAGAMGRCKVTGSHIRLARAALHYWEEPCISGPELSEPTRPGQGQGQEQGQEQGQWRSGSGTVFFSGCNLKCVYCQNSQISHDCFGTDVSISHLARIFLQLQHKGACNINLVTPTHYAPQIAHALAIAKSEGLHIPIVYNTSSYEKVEVLSALEDFVDIYLADYKYFNNESALRYSKAPNYSEIAQKAIAEMVRQKPTPCFDSNGLMTKGVIVRHLMLPGCEQESRNIINYLYNTYGNSIYISIMNQYTPPQDKSIFLRYPELEHRLFRRAYRRTINFALNIGLENAYIQEDGTCNESFIPPFDGEGLLL